MAVSNNLSTIKAYFGNGRLGRRVETKELKELSKDEREQLGKLAQAEIDAGRCEGP